MTNSYKIISKNCFLVYFVLISSLPGITQQAIKSKLIGTYITSAGDKTLVFTKDSFIYKQTISVEVSGKNGTVASYGTWSVDKNLILLSTPDLSADKLLELNVKENNNGWIDTIYLLINSPAEKEYEFNNKVRKMITYRVRIETSDGSTFYQRSRPFNIDSNVIKVYKPPSINLRAFSLEIFPNGEYEWEDQPLIFRTKEYSIQSPLNNVFNIDIPKLSWAFLSYRRLTKDFVRIHSSHKLEWDGRVFERK